MIQRTQPEPIQSSVFNSTCTVNKYVQPTEIFNYLTNQILNLVIFGQIATDVIYLEGNAAKLCCQRTELSFVPPRDANVSALLRHRSGNWSTDTATSARYQDELIT